MKSMAIPFMLAALAGLYAQPCEDPYSCDAANETLSRLTAEYGDWDYSCVNNPINGVIVDLWCCSKETRVVYYSFGHEQGCTEHGYELYECGSPELPESVMMELSYNPGGCEELVYGNPCAGY